MSKQRESAREGFERIRNIFGWFFRKPFPCGEPEKKQKDKKSRKNVEKPSKTYFPKFSLVLPWFDPRQRRTRKKRRNQILASAQGLWLPPAISQLFVAFLCGHRQTGNRAKI